MTTDDHFERLLADVLAGMAPSREPDRLIPEILRAARRVRRRPRWLALIKEPPMRISSRVAVGSPPIRRAVVVMLTAILVVLTAGAFVAGASPLPSPHPEPRIAWSTDRVHFTANDIAIGEGDATFSIPAGTDVALHSDPGGPDYWTLKASWGERGLEQRLYLYFASDGIDWWVSELRTHDGLAPADWITYRGSFFRTPLGAGFSGDVDLTSPGPPPGHFVIRGLTLTVSPRPLTQVYAAPPGGGVAAGSDPFDLGGPLYCSGILLLPPAEAQARLLALGFRVSWRIWGPQPTMFDQTVPPTGTIESSSVGSHGDVILFVDPPGVQRDRPTMPATCPSPAPVPSPGPTP